MRLNYKFLIFLSFTLSGLLGLMYEVIWQRELSLVFGSTLSATTAVLVAFMSGMAIGSRLFGKLSERVYNPFSLYGILLIGIGLYCLGMPLLFNKLYDLHIIVYNQLGESILLEVMRFVFAVGILLFPCALMGGTLPILSRALIQRKEFLGKNLSLLYFYNTLGASVGTLLAGFLMIRLFGMAKSNISIAIFYISLGAFIAVSFRKNSNVVLNKSVIKAPPHRLYGASRHLPFLYALVGLAGMTAQLAWVRSLNLVLGSTVYAFSMMLAAYLMGIAVGSLVAGWFIDKNESPLKTVAILAFCAWLGIILSVVLISRLPIILLFLFPRFHHSFLLWQSCLFFLSLLVVFPSTFFMGALFPAFGKAYVENIHKVGENIGNLYLWNTLGCIAGSIITAFLLIPSIGTRLSLISASAIYLLLSSGFLFIQAKNRQTRIQIFILMSICLLGYKAAPAWESALLDSGVYLYAPQLLEGFESNRKVLFEKEGFHSHVTVTEKSGVRSLRINGKTDGSDGGDLPTQSLLAILPLAHIQNPSNALVVGLGTGVTAGSALNFPNLKVDCVEIDDAVISASSFFNHVSGNPFLNSRFKIIHADARTVLSAGLETYDVIISEPSNPWITGVSNLFTVDYFTAAFNKLSEKGIMCQWIHSYYMDPDTLMIIFRSFQEVFPFCTLWEGSSGDYLILGSQHDHAPEKQDYAFLFSNALVKDDLLRLKIIDSSDFLQRLVLNSDEFLSMTRRTGCHLNTDNTPYVEFNAPMSLYRNTVDENRELILSFKLNG
ncbi:MAG: fused MFS/spermidine synthase [bacterium]